MANKEKQRKWQNLSIFKKFFSTPFCKKGLEQPAKSSRMSGFKDGGGVIVPGYLEFTALPTTLPTLTTHDF
jgi:hypothetical protein